MPLADDHCRLWCACIEYTIQAVKSRIPSRKRLPTVFGLSHRRWRRRSTTAQLRSALPVREAPRRVHRSVRRRAQQPQVQMLVGCVLDSCDSWRGGRLHLGLCRYHRVRGWRVLLERMGNCLFSSCYGHRGICAPNTNAALSRWSFRETLETLTLASLVRLKEKGGGASSVAQASLPFRCPKSLGRSGGVEFPDPAWGVTVLDQW